MKKHCHFLCFLILLCLVGCNSPDKRKSGEYIPTTLTFPNGIYESGCDGSAFGQQMGKRVLYYFDGDCALCFGKVKAIENLAASELGNIELVFIARTARVHMFNRNVLQARIKSCVQIDSLGSFERANPDKTYLDQMAVLDGANSILIEGNLIRDPDVLSSFKKALK